MSDKTNLNIAVLTSKFVMARSSFICYVTLHDDGVWEFWGKEEVAEADIMVVQLRQIINVDPSISQILDMPIGFSAIRGNPNDKWEMVSKN